jgi:uncharacterized protein (UPF0335 family)
MANSSKKTYVARTGGNSAGQLKSFVERIERLDEEKKAISDDIREIYAEAKGNGWDPKIMRIIVRRRKMAAAERAEQDALVDTYASALGMTAAEADSEETSSSD